MITKTKALTINLNSFIFLAKFLTLLSIATFAPILLSQNLTGPIVNASLFLAVYFLGLPSAIFIALIPSLVSLSIGFLPLALAPMIPFIMMGNIIMISTFNYFKDKNYWSAVFLSAIFKFAFLFTTSSLIINLIIKQELATKVANMLSYPQLITAIIGGLIAYTFINKKNRLF